MNYSTITPAELDGQMTRGDRITLIDVREPEEYMVASIAGARLLPLSRFNLCGCNSSQACCAILSE